MSQQKYPKAYEAYQQAVYREGRNPTFWCSIGVLYYQINQYRDALDAYSRAIRLNPFISEVWYDLGTLVRLSSSLHKRVDRREADITRSTSRATTKSATPSMPTREPQSLTRTTRTSRPDCSCFATGRATAWAAHRCPPMFTPMPTRRTRLGLQALSGPAPLRNSRRP